MPVGRVDYLYLWPITFDEFVKAQSDKFLTDSWQELTLNPDLPVSQALHESILQLLKIYLFVGGMPGVVSAYLDRHDFTEVSKFQEDILTSFKDDFAKYARGRDLNLMQRLFLTLPLHVTKKIKYSRLNPDEKSTIIKSMLDLFSKARIITPVLHSSANGIPLRAQVDPKIFKLLFADTGLLSHSLGLTQPPLKSEIEGVLHEQFIGQELRARDSTHDSELFYWVREKKHGNAEIDYLIQNNEQILPIEVKSGKAGSMRSMHQFMHEKKINIALRFDKNRSSQHNVSVTVQNGHETSQVNYLLRSYPLYLAAQASF
jgi:predicted AAA+ superfamily ATPase